MGNVCFRPDFSALVKADGPEHRPSGASTHDHQNLNASYNSQQASPRAGPSCTEAFASVDEEDGPPVSAGFSWQRGRQVGRGAFGTVYLALVHATGQEIAVKQVSLPREAAQHGRVSGYIRSLEREVDVLRSLRHENIVRYLGTERTGEHLNIFLEYVAGGPISDMLTEFGPLREETIRVYTKQILRGLEYLHQQKVVHRDIKGANILVDTDGVVKLADFGASKKIENLATIGGGARSLHGTAHWMAPESIRGGASCAADIWSLACVVIEMATGLPPWANLRDPMSVMFHVASTKEPPPLPSHLSAHAKDFLTLCFNRVPRERPSAARLLQHPWLQGVAVPRSKRPPPTLLTAPAPAPKPSTGFPQQQLQQQQPAGITHREQQQQQPQHTPSHAHGQAQSYGNNVIESCPQQPMPPPSQPFTHPPRPAPQAPPAVLAATALQPPCRPQQQQRLPQVVHNQAPSTGGSLEGSAERRVGSSLMLPQGSAGDNDSPTLRSSGGSSFTSAVSWASGQPPAPAPMPATRASAAGATTSLPPLPPPAYPAGAPVRDTTAGNAPCPGPCGGVSGAQGAHHHHGAVQPGYRASTTTLSGFNPMDEPAWAPGQAVLGQIHAGRMPHVLERSSLDPSTNHLDAGVGDTAPDPALGQPALAPGSKRAKVSSAEGIAGGAEAGTGASETYRAVLRSSSTGGAHCGNPHPPAMCSQQPLLPALSADDEVLVLVSPCSGGRDEGPVGRAACTVPAEPEAGCEPAGGIAPKRLAPPDIFCRPPGKVDPPDPLADLGRPSSPRFTAAAAASTSGRPAAAVRARQSTANHGARQRISASRRALEEAGILGGTLDASRAKQWREELAAELQAERMRALGSASQQRPQQEHQQYRPDRVATAATVGHGAAVRRARPSVADLF